ncbi:D-3-phosphoglycerate dehydrogenase [Caprobacter fermentans]|uniref:D-3-phosphoglycerate dehydrogenase n=1 Tax=Caproicibacter fermentans TaxID=2576756 RepID=A0A6N8I3E8_9FIRM|nr:phosphoglycerate dehydrogenase [Caproicibacter fermentans]MVB12604.1 D-3-phosphoglycerate dehydrogenase [Caproicibacter fermentans]OCM99990.1 3-phosphoglycerate dehydrogenase [Clostridium sp. W14A]QNK39169.1 phosphoglycerate dehydrogenase [Caproicibacter fermentans]
MYQIKCLNKISPVGTSRFGENYSCSDSVENPEAILVRSASMHEMELPANLLAVARAGAGVNNIPIDKCSEKGIVVFNTPGANANAVKELVLAGLLMSSRRIVSGIEWAKTLKGKGDEVGKLVEKGKSQFVGPEIKGKTLGVIGLGAIGILVANAAHSLGMEVLGYDPYLSVDAAWGLSRSVKHAHSLDDIYAESDYITVHVPLLPDTKEMINAEAISKMKDGVHLLNFARGGLFNRPDVLAAVKSGKVATYATDFPDDSLLGVENVLAFPHLGASTPESEDNCARMAADELIDYLENGNIRNAVNLPSVSMARNGFTRICLFHRNVPNVISKLSGILANANINIENMQSKAKKDYAYVILDVTGEVTEDTAEHLEQLPEIVRARVIPAKNK